MKQVYYNAQVLKVNQISIKSIKCIGERYQNKMMCTWYNYCLFYDSGFHFYLVKIKLILGTTQEANEFLVPRILKIISQFVITDITQSTSALAKNQPQFQTRIWMCDVKMVYRANLIPVEDASSILTHAYIKT